jgi:hypothetical protein
MKFFLKIFPLLLLITTINCIEDPCSDCEIKCPCEENINCIVQKNGCSDVFGKSFFASRSQGNNTARIMMGTQEKIHKFGSTNFYGIATAAVEFQKIFRADGIGNWFSTNGGPTMTYGLDYEANDPGAGTFDINAINFGVTGSGTISFCPEKDDIIFDIYTYLGLDRILCGLWLSVDIPIVHSRWNLNIQEKVIGDSINSYPIDSVGDGTVSNPFNVAKPMTQAFKGLVGFGDAPKLKYGKICGTQTATGVPGLRIDIGYDLARCPNYHFSVAFDFVVATGTQPRSEFLFEPIIGDQDRWQAGLNINAGWNFWKSCSGNNTLTLFFDGTINHLFGHRNNRILGINIPNATDAQKNWSYYLLLKKFNSSNQAIGLERAANIFTGPVRIKANIIGNLDFLVQWNCCNLMAGVGYEFWARTKEIFQSRCFNIDPERYSIKGSTDYDSTLVAPTTTISTNGATQEVTASGGYLTNNDFDPCPALHPSTYSNKVFGFIGYNWINNCFQPFVLVGGEVEFGKNNRAFSQWGFILKSGLSF